MTSLFYLGFLVFFGWNAGLTQTTPSHGEAEILDHNAFVKKYILYLYVCIHVYIDKYEF